MSWVNTAIYYSPYLIQFLFLILFASKKKDLINWFDNVCGESAFIVLGFCTLLIVIMVNYSYSYYTNALILYYIFQTIIYYTFLTGKYSIKDSISLAMMISFVSSFYWEMPIHLMVLFNGEPLINLLIQSMHLATLPFIFKRIVIIDKIMFYKYILYGLIVANISALMSLVFINGYFEYFNMLSRIVCAVMVIKGFLTNSKRK